MVLKYVSGEGTELRAKIRAKILSRNDCNSLLMTPKKLHFGLDPSPWLCGNMDFLGPAELFGQM